MADGLDPGPVIETERLLLRPWRDGDIEPFVALNTDPQVMRFFPWRYTREQSLDRARRFREHFAEHGWGSWVVELPECEPFVGIVGLGTVEFEAAFTPAVEVAWRIAAPHQGRGYATEAALASLRYGFETLGLVEIVSFTTRDNKASRRVMEKIGLVREPESDFDHPGIEPGHPMRRCVFYRLSADVWRRRGGVRP